MAIDLDKDDRDLEPAAEAPAPTGEQVTFREHMSRLYRGESTFRFIERRKLWYAITAVLLLLSLLSILVRGFNFSIEFEGGTQFQVEAQGTSITTAQVSDALSAAGHEPANAAQEVGSGATRLILVQSAELDPTEQAATTAAMAQELGIDPALISVDTVGSDWGADVTRKAVTSLIVFIIVVSIYIWIRFKSRYMAVGAIVALFHDIALSAGVYSLVGFEVSPSTIVGLLTILGFSLYDTVVVFDKVAENTRNLTAGSRETYSAAANRALNQTLMRSINTSLISLLPVAGLLFVGAFMLGVGTIKDLALILFIGLAVGTYSSLFLATPVLCEFTEREPRYQALAKRVAAREASDARRGISREDAAAQQRRPSSGPMPAPRPGARPANRPGGRRSSRRSS